MARAQVARAVGVSTGFLAAYALLCDHVSYDRLSPKKQAVVRSEAVWPEVEGPFGRVIPDQVLHLIVGPAAARKSTLYELVIEPATTLTLSTPTSLPPGTGRMTQRAMPMR